MKTRLFVAGMFRSGTTLLARMLNTHSKIIFASDTTMEFFKAFRNELYYKNNITLKNPNMPLEYNFRYKHKEIQDEIEKGDFSLELQFTKKKELRNKMMKYSKQFSPIFVENLEDFSGNKYDEIFDEIFDTIEKSYFKENFKIIGFKSTWSEQFVPTFINKYDENSKVIFIIRDPRATIASNYSRQNHRYPLEFLVRHWRKSIFYSIRYGKILQKYKNNCLIIQYEKLVSNPISEINKILKFLDLDFEEVLTNPSEYKDGENKPWVQNTSYQNPRKSFNTDSINKWKDVLDPKIQKFIEFACFPEIVSLGYPILFFKNSLPNEVVSYPMDEMDKMADWIKEFYSESDIKDEKWIENIENEELKRNKIFESIVTLSNHIERKDIDEYFGDSDFLNYLKNLYISRDSGESE